MIYRIARLNHRTDRWKWKSTILNSLDSVFHLLRIYTTAIPSDQLRVFSAHIKEDLEIHLKAENNDTASSSVTASQLLGKSPEQINQASEEKESTVLRSPRAIPEASKWEHSETIYAASAKNWGTLDKKRLEMEMGAGSDHDTPYVFAFPTAMPQMLVWIQLQNRTQKQGVPF